MRRIGLRIGVTLALICGLALGVAACGGSDSSGGGEESGASPAKPSELSGTITVWDIVSGSFPNYDPVDKELITEFERKYPNVTVDHVPQPFETYETLYRAAFAAHEGPDVAMMVTGVQGSLGFTEGLEVLSDRISPEMQEQITNWSTATAGFSTEGDHYGVPIGSTGEIFYYNKRLFQKAGLPRDFEPKTWNEVKEAGEKLKAAGIQPFTGGNKEGYENQWWFSAGWQTENTTKEAVELAERGIPYTDEIVAKAFGPEFMMQEAGLYPKNRFTTPLFPDGGALFGNEEGAMILGPQGTIGYWGEYDKQLGEKNVGTFLPPGSKYFGTEAEWVWTLPKFARNKDAAWAFIEFMASKESVQKFVDAGTFLPNRKDVTVPASAPEQAKQLVEWHEELELFPNAHTVVPAQVSNGPLTTEVNEALQGRTSLEAAQEAMQEAAEKSAR
jgi:ABC-type glycerol-3-phosphate transport system substrate-binding protein